MIILPPENKHRTTLTISSMKKVLILSVFAFFAFAVSAQTDASTTSSKSNTENTVSTKDAGQSLKNVSLNGTKAADSKTSECKDTAKDSKKGSCDKGAAACCAGKSADAGKTADAGKSASCCAGKSAASCDKGAKEEKKKD
jgi:hypothetical protein